MNKRINCRVKWAGRDTIGVWIMAEKTTGQRKGAAIIDEINP